MCHSSLSSHQLLCKSLQLIEYWVLRKQLYKTFLYFPPHLSFYLNMSLSHVNFNVNLFCLGIFKATWCLQLNVLAVPCNLGQISSISVI